MVTITINGLTLNDGQILRWRDGRTVPIPIKRIYGKCEPTTQADCFTADATRRTVRCKLTRTQKSTLYGLGCEWLAWTEDGTITDSVWIERIEMSWRGEDNYDYPWFTTLYLLMKSCPTFPLNFPLEFC